MLFAISKHLDEKQCLRPNNEVSYQCKVEITAIFKNNEMRKNICNL